MKQNKPLYFLGEAWRGIRQNSWMSIVSVGVVALTLLLFGLFVLMNINIDHIATEMESQVEIIAYLDLELAAEEEQAIRTQLLALPQVIQVEYVSKDMALERLREQLGDQDGVLVGYPDQLGNPLPASFEIKTLSPEDVPGTAEQIAHIAGISEVDYGAGLVEQLLEVTKIARWIGSAFMLLLAASATFLIAHTVRMAIYIRRREIMIMKYVGATNWFIRWPFMIEGMFLGVIGSLLPILLLNYLYRHAIIWTSAHIAILSLVPVAEASNYLWFCLLPLGVVLGSLGSGLSLSRYLDV